MSHHWRAVLACFFLLTAGGLGLRKAESQTAASFSLEQVMSTPFASALTAAPQGGRVAWVLNIQGRRNVWLADSPEWNGRQITSFAEDDGQDILQISWTPNGKGLLFTRGGDDEANRPNPNPTGEVKPVERSVWMAFADGSPAQLLAPGTNPVVPPSGARVWFLRHGQVFSMKLDGSGVESAFQVQGTATDLTWSPDGQHLAFTNQRPDHSFIGVYTPGEKHLRFLDPSVDSDSSPVWSLDGTKLAFLRRPAHSLEPIWGPKRTGYPWSIHVVDIKSGRASEIFKASVGQGSVFHDVVADKQLLWTASNRIVFPYEKTGWLHLYSIASEGGPVVELTPGIGEVEHVAMTRDGSHITYSANFGDGERRHLWNLELTPESRPIALTSGEGLEWNPRPVSGTNAVAFIASSYNSSAHAEVLSPAGRSVLAGQTVPAVFPKANLVKPEAVTLLSADGLELHGQLFQPSSPGPHPALVFFHGGSRRQMLLGFHSMYYYSNAYAMNQYLANHGYVVLSVNYRSGIGYGLNFREALHYGATGASEYADVQGAAFYLRSRGNVDPKRIGAWGGSYGGYLTGLALARASDLYAAGVDFHGVHDWNIEFRGETIPGSPQAQADFVRTAFESSPLAHVSTWRSPVLLIHGDDDRTVAFAQTVQLVEALRQRNIGYEELIIPNEIHDFLLWRDWITAYEATANFFDRKLH